MVKQGLSHNIALQKSNFNNILILEVPRTCITEEFSSLIQGDGDRVHFFLFAMEFGPVASFSMCTPLELLCNLEINIQCVRYTQDDGTFDAM